jgi:hypothetical protein
MDGQQDTKATERSDEMWQAEAAVAAGDDPSLRPWTEDDDLSGVEVVATSGDTELRVRYCVDLDAEETRLVTRAGALAGLDYLAIAKRAILEAAREALARHPPPRRA